MAILIEKLTLDRIFQGLDPKLQQVIVGIIFIILDRYLIEDNLTSAILLFVGLVLIAEVILDIIER